MRVPAPLTKYTLPLSQRRRPRRRAAGRRVASWQGSVSFRPAARLERLERPRPRDRVEVVQGGEVLLVHVASFASAVVVSQTTLRHGIIVEAAKGATNSSLTPSSDARARPRARKPLVASPFCAANAPSTCSFLLRPKSKAFEASDRLGGDLVEFLGEILSSAVGLLQAERVRPGRTAVYSNGRRPRRRPGGRMNFRPAACPRLWCATPGAGSDYLRLLANDRVLDQRVAEMVRPQRSRMRPRAGRTDLLQPWRGLPTLKLVFAG